MLPYGVGGGLPVVEGGGSLMTYTAGSVTTQSIAFKCVMASEPHRNTWYFKQVMAGLPYIKIYFFNPILHTVWLDNHALTLKSNSAKYYFHEKSRFLHTFLKFCCESRKNKVKFKNILLSVQ